MIIVMENNILYYRYVINVFTFMLQRHNTTFILILCFNIIFYYLYLKKSVVLKIMR